MSGHDLVHQIVLRWDSANRSSGLGPVAYSCSPVRAEQVYRMLRPALSGDRSAPMAVARVCLDDGRYAVLRRVLGRDEHGRPGFQSHALVGDAGVLTLQVSLGIGLAAWPSLDQPLSEARGPLPALRATEVRERGKAALQQLTAGAEYAPDLAVQLLAGVLRRRADRLWIVTDADWRTALRAVAMLGRIARCLPDTHWFRYPRWLYDTGVGDSAELVTYAFTRLRPPPGAVGASDVILVAAADCPDPARDVACQLVEWAATDYAGLSDLLMRCNEVIARVRPESQLEALAERVMSRRGRTMPPAPPPFVARPEPTQPVEPDRRAAPVARRPALLSPSVARVAAVRATRVTDIGMRLLGPLMYRLRRRESPPTDAELSSLINAMETARRDADRADGVVPDDSRLLGDPDTLVRALRMTSNPGLADHLVGLLCRLVVRLPRRQRMLVAAEVMDNGLWIDRWPDAPGRRSRRVALLYDTVVRTVPTGRLRTSGPAMVRAMFRSDAGRDFIEGLVHGNRPTHWSDATWREFLRLDREAAAAGERPPTLDTVGSEPEPAPPYWARRLLVLAVVVTVVGILVVAMIGFGR